MPGIKFFFVIIIIITTFICLSCASRMTGTFYPDEFFKFILKFGFQKTDRHSQRDSFGYIYGNITSPDIYPVRITFSVLDKNRFLEYYENRSIFDKEVACQRMFKDLEQFAYDKTCNVHEKGDFLRKVPCTTGKLCEDEESPENVVEKNQFTYLLSNIVQPRFWYISMVACYRNVTTCKWHHFDTKIFDKNGTKKYAIFYDFKVVNGNPNQSSSTPLTYHFPFDQQNILEMNLIFFVVYLILVPLQIYAVRIQKHPVTKLFTISLVLEFISLIFILSYMIRFAISGIGNETFKTTGDILDILSRTSFMLILLLLAKGWAVTRQQISRTGWFILMTIWITYCAFHMVLYVWNRTEVDIVSDIDEYQTWPGLLVLACRSCIMLWFLWELRNTMKYEHSNKKLDFLLHFGASSLVWFIYLPIMAIVSLQVNPLWRYKLILGITNSADCLAYCVMMGLLWPNRAGQYLLLAGTRYAGMDELDEFNEAPHIVHGDINDCSTVIERSESHQGYIPTNGDLNIGLLDDDEEDIVLSTDDLLIGNNIRNHFSATTQPNVGDNILHINSDRSSELSKNTDIIT